MVTDMTTADAKACRDNAINCVQRIVDLEMVDEEECVVRDTIANLMHWCDTKGMDFEYELKVAWDSYEAEKEDKA